MPGTYPDLRIILERFITEVDALLSGITDDRLHYEVNQAARHAAEALLRINAINAARARS